VFSASSEHQKNAHPESRDNDGKTEADTVWVLSPRDCARGERNGAHHSATIVAIAISRADRRADNSTANDSNTSLVSHPF
jgi:hypothetical protein